MAKGVLQESRLNLNLGPRVATNFGPTRDVTPFVGSWRSTERRMGGWYEAEFGAALGENEFDFWMKSIGMDVALRDRFGLVWNGFVNQITLQVGGVTFEVGPMMALANQVYVTYSPLVLDDNGIPVPGQREVTTTGTDSESQERYGIWEKYVDAGEVYEADAEQVRDIYLQEFAWPVIRRSYASGMATGDLSVRCLGYSRLLEAYSYDNAAGTGSTNVGTMIENVLGDEPNGVFGTGYGQVAANALSIPDYAYNQSNAWGMMMALVARGDSSYNPYRFGIYTDREPVYEAVEDEVVYWQYGRSRDMRVEGRGHQDVPPWRLRAGRWLMLADLMVGYSGVPLADIRDDPRTALLEQVTFTAPDGVEWVDGKEASIKQKLSDYGLQTVGA